MTKEQRRVYDKAYREANKEKRANWAKAYKELTKNKPQVIEYIKEIPHDFWNYGINPILGYRYMPDNNAKPTFLKGKPNAASAIKS